MHPNNLMGNSLRGTAIALLFLAACTLKTAYTMESTSLPSTLVGFQSNQANLPAPMPVLSVTPTPEPSPTPQIVGDSMIYAEAFPVKAGEILLNNGLELHATGPDGTDDRLLLRFLEHHTMVNVAVSPDGHHAAVLVAYKPYLVDLQKGSMAQITSSDLQPPGYLAWSIDGNILFYTDDRTIWSVSVPLSGEPEIIYHTEGGKDEAGLRRHIKMLTSNRLLIPEWRADLAETYRVSMLDLTTHEVHPVLDGYNILDISRDGQKVLLSRWNEENQGVLERVRTANLTSEEKFEDIRTVNIQGDALKYCWAIDFSLMPDGQGILGAAHPPDDPQICQVVLLKPQSDGQYSVSWYPDYQSATAYDNMSILATERNDTLWRVPLDGSPAILISQVFAAPYPVNAEP